MNVLKKVKHFLSEFVTLLIRLLPVRNRVFFYTIRSNDVPLDNLKCVYDAVKGKKALFAHMLPHSFGQMLRARYALLTSRVIVTDDYIRYLRQVPLHKQQKVIQLWHAAGAFKRFGLDAPSRLTPEEERRTHDRYSDVIVSGEAVRSFYAGAFGVPLSVVKPLGVPRTDALFDPARRSAASSRVLEKYPFLAGKTVYLYAPTFREIDGTVIDFDPKIDFEALDAQLLADEVFLVRRHPVMKRQLVSAPCSRVHEISDCSTANLLTLADVLITDYSSVVFDAALLNIPIVFYCPDLASYERTFYLDLIGEAPDAVVLQDTVLLQKARNCVGREADEKANQLVKAQLSSCDGHATERVVQLVESYLK